jgi:hypothetical protein
VSLWSVLAVSLIAAGPALAQGHGRGSTNWNRDSQGGQGCYSQQQGPSCEQDYRDQGYGWQDPRQARYQNGDGRFGRRGEGRCGYVRSSGWGHDGRGWGGRGYRSGGGGSRQGGTWEQWQRRNPWPVQQGGRRYDSRGQDQSQAPMNGRDDDGDADEGGNGRHRQ